MPPLKNPKQEIFAQNIVKGMRTSDAFVAAGYKAKNAATAAASATRLLKNATVAARIAALKEKSAKKAELTQQWIIERLMRNAQVCFGEVPIKRKFRLKDSDEPVEMEVTEFEPSAGNRAMELLGKTLRMFVDQVEHGGPGDFTSMSDEELDRLIMERQMVDLYEAEAGSDSVN